MADGTISVFEMGHEQSWYYLRGVHLKKFKNHHFKVLCKLDCFFFFLEVDFVWETENQLYLDRYFIIFLVKNLKKKLWKSLGAPLVTSLRQETAMFFPVCQFVKFKIKTIHLYVLMKSCIIIIRPDLIQIDAKLLRQFALFTVSWLTVTNYGNYF